MEKELIIGQMENNDILTYTEYDVSYEEIRFYNSVAEDDFAFEEMVFSERNIYDHDFSISELKKMFAETPGCIYNGISIRQFLVSETEIIAKKGVAA